MACNYEPAYGWHESATDWFVEIGAAIGFEISNVYFSGFWSQGDGACFGGKLTYRKGWRAALAEVCSDSEVVEIAERWQALQKRVFYSLYASVKQSGHYQHEYCTSFDIEDSRDSWRELPSGAEDECEDIARDLMRWMYRQLESEYEYQRAASYALAWQEQAEVMADSRKDARALVSDMRKAIRAGLNAGDSICHALRSKLRDYMNQWEEARQERESIADNFHYWKDGKSLSIAEFATQYA